MLRFFEPTTIPVREWLRPLTVLTLSVLLLVLFLAPWRFASADVTSPTVSLMCPTSESDSFLNTDVHGHNLSALVRFSEPVIGFPSNDSILLSTGSLIWNRQGVSVTQDGVDVVVPGSQFYFFRDGFFHGMYIFRATVKDDVSGTVVAQVPAGVATDADGNVNTASIRLRLSRNRKV